MRIGIVSRTATYWPLYLMATDGLVELVELGSTAAGVGALLHGDVDVAATCPDELIASGAAVRVGAGLVDRPPTSLVAREHVASIEALRGTRIATTSAQGSVSLFLRALLRARGLERGDYTEVVIGPTPEQAAALERGDADAAMLTAPFDERLVARGFRILAVGDELGRCAFTTLNVRRGYSRTPEWSAFRSALSVAMTRLADTAGRSRELPALVDGTRGAVRTPPHVIYDAVVDLQAVGRLIAFMRAEGIPAPGDASEHVERGVAIRALERLPGGRSRDLA